MTNNIYYTCGSSWNSPLLYPKGMVYPTNVLLNVWARRDKVHNGNFYPRLTNADLSITTNALVGGDMLLGDILFYRSNYLVFQFVYGGDALAITNTVGTETNKWVMISVLWGLSNYTSLWTNGVLATTNAALNTNTDLHTVPFSAILGQSLKGDTNWLNYSDIGQISVYATGDTNMVRKLYNNGKGRRMWRY